MIEVVDLAAAWAEWSAGVSTFAAMRRGDIVESEVRPAWGVAYRRYLRILVA